MHPTVSPRDVDVFWTRVQAMLDGQASALRRTGFSPILRESGDCSIGLFGLDGSLLVQATLGSQGHVIGLPAAIRRMLDTHDGSLDSGDVLISNEPYYNTGHQYDVAALSPVTVNGQAVGYVASTCHLMDVGGRPLSADGRDVFEEGIIIPPVKLVTGGVANRTIVEIIRANVRTPREVIGDLFALVGANRIIVESVRDVILDLGLTSLADVESEIYSRSETAFRRAVSAIPDGSYLGAAVSDGVTEPVTIAARVDVKGSDVTIDFDGSSSASAHGINVALNFTRSYALFTLKAVIAPGIPNNAGTMRAIAVSAPEGSILNAVPPAPLAMRHVIGHLIPSAILRALAGAVPDRVAAPSAGAVWHTVLRGTSREGTPFHVAWDIAGGMGARPMRDGLDTTFFPAGTRGVPIEVLESLAPIVFRERRIIPDSGGAGKFRGGCGQRLVIEVDSSEPCTFITSSDHVHQPAEGLLGGLAGRKGTLALSSGRSLPGKTANAIPAGDAVVIELPGGGGYGPPMARDRASVEADVRQGVVSVVAAVDLYGITVGDAYRDGEIGERAAV